MFERPPSAFVNRVCVGVCGSIIRQREHNKQQTHIAITCEINVDLSGCIRVTHEYFIGIHHQLCVCASQRAFSRAFAAASSCVVVVVVVVVVRPSHRRSQGERISHSIRNKHTRPFSNVPCVCEFHAQLCAFVSGTLRRVCSTCSTCSTQQQCIRRIGIHKHAMYPIHNVMDIELTLCSAYAKVFRGVAFNSV